MSDTNNPDVFEAAYRDIHSLLGPMACLSTWSTIHPNPTQALAEAQKLAATGVGGHIQVGYRDTRGQFVPLWTRHGKAMRRVRANAIPTQADEEARP